MGIHIQTKLLNIKNNLGLSLTLLCNGSYATLGSPQLQLVNLSIIIAESTNAGKTLPQCLFPYLVEELNSVQTTGLSLTPKGLFLTALNSIKNSLAQNMKSFGLNTAVLSVSNATEVVKCKSVRVVFVSPETLKNKWVIQALLSERDCFLIKCIDEAHLFTSWGIEKQKKNIFRPAMQLPTEEFFTLSGMILMQTVTATSRTVRILESEFPVVDNWIKILNIPNQFHVFCNYKT